MGHNFKIDDSDSKPISTEPERIKKGIVDDLLTPYNTIDYISAGLSQKGGVWDLTNYLQFTPYESGYCFLGVISSPICMTYKLDDRGITINPDNSTYNALLQEAFVKMLENEFRGIDGIEDITSETVDITDNISTMSLISKINLQSSGTFTMRFTEKSGSLITKYISRYLKCIRDPKTRAKTYGGILKPENITGGNGKEGSRIDPSINKEVFNFLYVITDSTCLRVEKAFLILNAQPTTAAYSELYNVERGNIEIKELSVPFNGYIVDGKSVNKIAKSYINTLINLTIDHDSINNRNKINLNSENFGYSINGVTIGGNSGKTGKITKVEFK